MLDTSSFDKGFTISFGLDEVLRCGYSFLEVWSDA